MHGFLRFVLLSSLALLALGCADEPDIDQAIDNVYAGSGIKIAETARFVYVERPLEDLNREEQTDAYRYVMETLVRELDKTKLGQTDTAQTVLDKMWNVNMDETIQQLDADLEEYAAALEEHSGAAPPQAAWPSAIMLWVSIPASANYVVGLSGSVKAMLILKTHMVTRLHKDTGEVDENWWRFRWEAAPAAIPLTLGLGVGAGGGVGLAGGIGGIWGTLDKPEDFRGWTARVSWHPFTAGVGPVLKLGVRWNKDATAKPANTYFMIGAEAGANGKVSEVHVQAGKITGLFDWIANKLNFGGINEAGLLDAANLE